VIAARAAPMTAVLAAVHGIALDEARYAPRTARFSLSFVGDPRTTI
jgi:hypothetical protein